MNYVLFLIHRHCFSQTEFVIELYLQYKKELLPINIKEKMYTLYKDLLIVQKIFDLLHTIHLQYWLYIYEIFLIYNHIINYVSLLIFNFIEN